MPAYAKKYDYDIFVSYAIVDDQPVISGSGATSGPSLGWVGVLIRSLENVLAQELGKPEINVWRDVKGIRETPEILRNVERSAIFLMIFSKGFRNSKWCAKELRCFMKQLKMQSGNSLSRIFIVEKTNYQVKPSRRLKTVFHHRFWYKDQNGIDRTYAFLGSQPDIVYCHTVQDIARDMIRELDRLNP